MMLIFFLFNVDHLTALHIEVEKGNDEIVLSLLSNSKIDVNIKSIKNFI